MSLKSPDLPQAFRDVPIAHRGLHDLSKGFVENSRGAVLAAADAGYGIEIDVVEAACGEAVVFHDSALKRLTRHAGKVIDLTAAELGKVPYVQSVEHISSFAQILEAVGGRAPLLIELKDHDATFRTSAERLVASVARSLQGYEGPVAVMGFNPDTVRRFAERGLDVAYGITSCRRNAYSLRMPSKRRAGLASLAEFDGLGAAFVSHDRRDLDNPAVIKRRKEGTPVLCWTIRSPKEAAKALRFADNITFEGFRP